MCRPMYTRDVSIFLICTTLNYYNTISCICFVIDFYNKLYTNTYIHHKFTRTLHLTLQCLLHHHPLYPTPTSFPFTPHLHLTPFTPITPRTPLSYLHFIFGRVSFFLTFTTCIRVLNCTCNVCFTVNNYNKL